MTRSLIASLGAMSDGPVSIAGWVDTVRDQKKVQFVILRDESGTVQLVNPAIRGEDAGGADSDLTTAISELTTGTFVRVDGELKHDERVKLGGIEVRIHDLRVETVAAELPIAADSGLDKRLDWRFLDLRGAKQNLMFRVQTTLAHALRTWWVEHGFLEIHTPKLMASPSESRAELFSLDYFETTAYLAQSPQLFKQMAQAAGFGRVFEIGPAFRADPSFTSRHATEFTSVDAEMSWVSSHEDVMQMHESLLTYAIKAVADAHGGAIKETFGFEVAVPEPPFPRIPLAEARQIVAGRGYTIPRSDGDLDPEGERQVSEHAAETYGSEFVFVTDYDSSIRPFYHMRHEHDPSVTRSYDLLFRGTEIATGAQREHRIDPLIAQARDKGVDPDEIDGYLDFFRYGVPPHGGFGMGLARLVMLLLHETSIREVTYLFRGPTRLEP